MASGAVLRRALDQLLEVTVLLGADMTAGLAAMGLTPARAHILHLLAAEGPCPQRRLAVALQVTPRAVTGYVDDLTAAGLITREPHPTDRRVTLVTPTEAGRELSDALVAGRADLAGQLFDDVPPDELATVVDALDGVLERLRALLEAHQDRRR